MPKKQGEELLFNLLNLITNYVIAVAYYFFKDQEKVL